MASRHKLAHPIFIISVLILVLNDWYLKQIFHNGITGKLSDVAGLFDFPFLLAAMFPNRAKVMYAFTFFIFIVWKSVLMQPIIDGLNNFGIPVHRVIDHSDYITLLVLPFSSYVFNKSAIYALKPILLRALSGFSILAFVATSMPRGVYTKFESINKTYSFNCSKRELVARVNSLQMEYVHDMDKYAHQDNNGLHFDSKTNMFYYTPSYKGAKRDTVARILDYEMVKDTDTIRLKTSYADIAITGNDKTSELKLIGISRYVRKSEKGNHLQKSTALFERFVVKKISKYGK